MDDTATQILSFSTALTPWAITLSVFFLLGGTLNDISKGRLYWMKRALIVVAVVIIITTIQMYFVYRLAESFK